MTDLFNELIQCFSLVVSMLFNDLEFITGLTVGWVLLALSALGLVIYYLYGRTH